MTLLEPRNPDDPIRKLNVRVLRLAVLMTSGLAILVLLYLAGFFG
jgi:hypothetical protein